MLNMFHGTLQPLAGASRTLMQLAEDGLLPRLLALRSRRDVPWVATLLTSDAPAVQLCRQTNDGVAMPYELVTSEVGLIGLLEPLRRLLLRLLAGLRSKSAECIQATTERDRAYWTR